MTATASDDDAIGLQRVQAALLNDAASAAALQGLLAQTLALFPSPSLPELGQAIEDARARLAVYKERGNSGDQDPMATADVDMLSRIQRMRATGMSEKEILSSAQLTPTKGGDQAAELPPQSLRAGSCPPPAVPTHGTEPWGSWSHSVDEIVLELELPDGVRAKELDVDVVEGWLYVQRTSAAAEADAAPPLLFGRLAQSHLASELMWAVDTLSDGRQMLLSLRK